LGNLSTPSATTRSNIRRELLTLWRWAFEERLTEQPPLRVMRIRASAKSPEAWSLADLSRMLDCAEEDETVVHRKSGMRACDYMPCWICVAYDTGLRFSDMLALTNKQIRNGFVVTTAQKTNKPATRPLSKYSLQQVEKLGAMSTDGSLFSWFLTRRRALLAMRAFFDRHEFVGSSKYLRRSCATYIDSERPGEATRYLQHSATHLARKHYIDESLLAVPAGPPPIRS
jgi:integrase